MKKQLLKKALILLLFGISVKVEAQSTSMINKVSETITGQTDTLDAAPIIMAGTNIVVSANQKVTATKNDFKTTALSVSNSSIWAQSYNPYTKKAFTTVSTSDASGNIYVAGSTYINGTNGQDLTVMKYNNLGVQQWVKQYNGTGSNSDVASGIALDNAGNVIVTGASFGSGFSLVDFVTLKYSNSGTLLWTSRYNFANSMDIPAGVSVDNSNNVIVSGSSGSSLTNWDFATVKYNGSTGAQIVVKRQANAGIAQDKLIAQTRDANGNIYTTGATSSNGINFDVQTIKYDSSMNLIWVKTFDAFGNYDQGTDIAVDNLGNVIVVGYSTNSSLNKQLLVLKYNSSGTLQWNVQRQPQINSGDAMAIKVVLDASNEIFVGGNYTTLGNMDMAIMRFSPTGDLNIHKTYNGAANLNDQLLDFTLNGNDIFVSGKSNNGIIDQNVTIKYTYMDFPQNVATALSSSIQYMDNEVVIRFDKKTVKMATINNKDILFGVLSDFVQDSTCNKINGKIKTDVPSQQWITRKIFTHLVEADSLSQTRLGDFIKVPEFYCALVVNTPTSLNTPNVTSAISTIKPDVYYAEPDYVGYAAGGANDAFYSINQGALHPTTLYPNGHINVDSAWTITSGESFIRVGVYDSGIESSNPDFTGLTISGEDFDSNILPPLGGDVLNHGTSVAGIIGAVRNNNVGIAGIAGGNDSINKQGVTLYDCRIFAPSGNLAYIAAINALNTGVKGQNIGGYGLHVTSNSYFFGFSAAGYFWTLTQDSFNLFADQINFANRNGVVFAGAKTNANVPTYAFPADFSNEIQMSVGSSGWNGEKCNGSINCTSGSAVGGNIDFVAPGTDELIESTVVGGSFSQVHGTSMATPHVSGACALMMSYVNKPTANWDNLVHEDCEAILKRTCTDLTNTPVYLEHIGQDSMTGFGRINTYAALKALNKNYYKIFHIDQTHYVNSFSKAYATVASSLVINWPTMGAVASGTYFTDIVEVTTTLNYNLAPGQIILQSWPLYKACHGWQDTAFIKKNRDYITEIVSVTNTQAVLKTYYFRTPTNGFTYPESNIGNITSAISLYVYDPSGTLGIKDNLINHKDFVTFPNPSNNEFNVVFGSDISSKLNYKVTDVLGREVLIGNYTTQYGKNTLKLNAEGFSNGIYILNIYDNNKMIYNQKLLKN